MHFGAQVTSVWCSDLFQPPPKRMPEPDDEPVWDDDSDDDWEQDSFERPPFQVSALQMRIQSSNWFLITTPWCTGGRESKL